MTSIATIVHTEFAVIVMFKHFFIKELLHIFDMEPIMTRQKDGGTGVRIILEDLTQNPKP
jgi:hypothetical protein